MPTLEGQGLQKTDPADAYVFAPHREHPAALTPGDAGTPANPAAQSEHRIGEALALARVVVPAGHAMQDDDAIKAV